MTLEYGKFKTNKKKEITLHVIKLIEAWKRIGEKIHGLLKKAIE